MAVKDQKLRRAVDAVLGTTDHWSVEKRYYQGWQLLSGAGTDGGQWAAKGPGERKVFSSRKEAEEHIERSLED